MEGIGTSWSGTRTDPSSDSVGVRTVVDAADGLRVDRDWSRLVKETSRAQRFQLTVKLFAGSIFQIIDSSRVIDIIIENFPKCDYHNLVDGNASDKRLGITREQKRPKFAGGRRSYQVRDTSCSSTKLRRMQPPAE